MNESLSVLDTIMLLKILEYEVGLDLEVECIVIDDEDHWPAVTRLVQRTAIPAVYYLMLFNNIFGLEVLNALWSRPLYTQFWYHLLIVTIYLILWSLFILLN